MMRGKWRIFSNSALSRSLRLRTLREGRHPEDPRFHRRVEGSPGNRLRREILRSA